ncbi:MULTISPECIES: cupin domain-containing protein [unclassified Undibacterium]|jgi:quercetin dioxygenase-like cupin family protein|uniref:cupin domain-containing protein n=1 Tax=unclassified Undibacterium TaxID=2630295 RepID=UPI002AC9B8EE|nr:MULTISPECIES: cupin domain-containing protein [unclassified Undibacterium]MEB0138377.1 cupin domain-containing protein [Undibacterium sp. CCC2.1]MEB0171252.1 cupin domain-containing protein [Undibacterium sp. CCC1.1]MEB0176626.1 cupin domain-containing protein [Undibacterium sp. CCC3.4]MEB0214005.1 cupin domain-containing protein [Undibacterium sp. 5I2]WPX43621.1 cupin domain-containing protein [Undibacterium sp. CCC3.4]
MSLTSHSSADFGRVPSELSVDLPQRLIHTNVTGNLNQDEQAFSHDRKHQVNIVDLPSRVISMTVGGLEPGQSTRRHRHNYETLIYVLEGSGMSIIGGSEVRWQRGDAFYVPVWAWHEHINVSVSDKASYLACENAPHLQNLGIALREEA